MNLVVDTKYLRLAVIGIILAVGVIVIAFQHHSAQTACGPYRNDKTVSVGIHRLAAETATNVTAWNKGLSGRPCITSDEAMLFIFPRASQYAFWMKDMRFPIDIIWISQAHRVVAIEDNVRPSTYPDHFVNQKQNPAKYTLEIAGNSRKNLGINLGTAVNF